MKQVLNFEKSKEICNAAALGMFNASVEISGKNDSFRTEAIDLISNIQLDIDAVERNIKYWKNNGSRQEVNRYTERKEQLLSQVKNLKIKYNL